MTVCQSVYPSATNSYLFASINDMILANCSAVKKYITTASLVSSKITVQPFYPLTFFAFCSNLSDDVNQEFFQMTNQNVIFFSPTVILCLCEIIAWKSRAV